MTCTDTALRCVPGRQGNTGRSHFMPQVMFLRNSKQIGYKTPISNRIFPGG